MVYDSNSYLWYNESYIDFKLCTLFWNTRYTKSFITQNINIAKIGILIFLSVQLSGHLSCKYGHFWGVVNWERPLILLYYIKELTDWGHEEICD